MTEKLFDCLRVVFGSHKENKELLRWAQTEYGKDWQYAYTLLQQGKTPIRGVDY